MSTHLNYPGLQAGDGNKDVLKRALAQNSNRGNMVIRLLCRAEAHQNEFYLSLPGLKAGVIQIRILKTT